MITKAKEVLRLSLCFVGDDSLVSELEWRVMDDAFQRAIDTGNTSVQLFPLSGAAEMLLSTKTFIVRFMEEETKYELSDPSVFYDFRKYVKDKLSNG